MTKIEESMLQLKADVEELKEYSEESEKAFDVTDEILRKVFDPINKKPSAELTSSDLKTMSILLEEQYRKISEVINNEIRIITRVSPVLEAFFEDFLSNYEKAYHSAFQSFKSMIDKPDMPKFEEYRKHMNYEKIAGKQLTSCIIVARVTIESIMNRLEN